MVSLLFGFSCQNKIDGTPKFDTNLSDTVGNGFHVEKIQLEELPHSIKDGIHKNELFAGLTISSIVRIKEKNMTYYDMTFRDFDGQLIMVYYDEEGKIMVP